MYNDNMYEKNKLKERIIDIGILAAFTIITAVISTILMDLIVYPIALFAIHQKATFNTVFNGLVKFLVIVTPTYLIFAKAAKLKKSGIATKEILLFFLKKPLRFSIIVLFVLLCSAIIIAFLYILLNNNNYLIYKLSN